MAKRKTREPPRPAMSTYPELRERYAMGCMFARGILEVSARRDVQLQDWLEEIIASVGRKSA